MLKKNKAESIKTFWIGTLGLPASIEDVKSLADVSLYRNAVYLILNYALLGLTGFFFWMAAARLYSAEVVGLASSAISAAGLLTMISNLGMDLGLIRFLPFAGSNRNALISSSFTIAGIMAIAFALIFIEGTGIWSPALSFLLVNPLYFFTFIFVVLANSLQTLAGQCFIAARASRYVLIQGLMIGVLRFIPMLLLALLTSGLGIFWSWGIAVVLTALISILVFMPRVYNGVNFLPSLHDKLDAAMVKFSIANFISSICWLVPQTVLPILVLNLLGAEQNAYFYIGWSIAGIVFMVPSGVSNALLAEVSKDEQKLRQEVRKSIKFIVILLIPVVLVLLFAGNYVLMLFGKIYSENAFNLLCLLVISSLPLSLNYIFFTVRRAEKKMMQVILLSAFIAVGTITGSYYLMPRLGIAGVALGWLICQTTAGLFTFPYLLHRFIRYGEG